MLNLGDDNTDDAILRIQTLTQEQKDVEIDLLVHKSQFTGRFAENLRARLKTYYNRPEMFRYVPENGEDIRPLYSVRKV